MGTSEKLPPPPSKVVEGAIVGLTVGAFVGPTVGATVGLTVGATVGLPVGATGGVVGGPTNASQGYENCPFASFTKWQWMYCAAAKDGPFDTQSRTASDRVNRLAMLMMLQSAWKS
jgi:hypothetical protein